MERQRDRKQEGGKGIWKEYVLPAVVIPVGGFVLFNLGFLLDALFQLGAGSLLGLLLGEGWQELTPGLSISLNVVFAGLVLAAYALAARSPRIPTLVKAVFATLPAVFLLATVGLGFFSLSGKWGGLGAGALLAAAAVGVLVWKKKSWMYSYAVLFSGVCLALTVLLGIDI